MADPQLTYTSLNASEQWQIAERVAGSVYFRKSPKLRNFLLYIVENALLGREDEVCEQLIGHRVFGRPANYNVTEDNIVRVEARELRKRLGLYFAGEGKEESVTIEVPKGGYLPVFRAREQHEPAELPSAPLALGDSLEQGEPAPKRARHFIFPVFAILTGLLLALTLSLWWENRSLRHELRREMQSGMTAPDINMYTDLLGPVGTAGRGEAFLVLSNPKVLRVIGSDSPDANSVAWRLADFTMPVPMPPREPLRTFVTPAQELRKFLFIQRVTKVYTGMGEAITAYHLGRLMQSLGRQVRLTQGRFLNWDRVQKQDVVVLGSPNLNEWTAKYYPPASFEVVKGGVRNSKPLPGEQALYESSPDVDYAVASMLTTQSGAKMLVFAGFTSAGTAAVGEFFADPANMKPVYRKVRAAGPGPLDWELLLRVNVKDAIPIDTSVVSVRARRSRS